ncbi:AdeA/AdeI family multidrug efflux RND transporter periplasmic adaptor subunit [Acinetobacter haemolyticus]|uniref:AdeA/AdeI family multidrug efflux RND transporter periplasmic adaptor subunit n=1 Tax=Acinetobacter haemolyticus TaxID=29430 RepID=A0A3Q8XJV7_ACIHA|nr:AdeA/AdeI family multidrug efflux RND transporter periplasmic adaptor subunit [Acinetobacter haemolyticus]AZN68326.1 AdeA/AdeI family multidrug efflux RND transporter periplasmic adaptor subunit [Acinetobacter haemolyticus]MQZ30856.1 AdeA/AdeI family multidrug efflux RND transporter periplasmic adaptor subunit [Acinetobacter haemolyticus]NAR56239.1 AdeA/AdeI family multidrug efflux RND transporter periplasmic adaptor subunit [Acinetobacter haemolyticus]QBQ15459.1 AdeA/AdeI family multidrug e
MMSAKLWAPALTACALATSIALVGCSKDTDDAQQAAAAQQMPPAEVGVIVAQPQSIEQNVELSGRTSAYQISEVRPQTSGVILKRLFTEGSYVSEGQALYELDSRANRAALDNAKAALLQQQANLSSLRTKLNRYQQLVSSNAVSKQEYDDLLGQVRVSEAQVAAAQAQVKNAEVDFGYSTIRSPISGQSGRSSVTAGALVTANQTAPLVTIQQLDPIYVDINQSSAELLRLRQQLSKGSLSNSNNTKVKLKLEDGSTYPIEGQLTFSDASVNQDTGTVTLRAVFSNPNHLLLPGMYTTAQIVQGLVPNAYLIPQAAVARLPTGQATVMIVNDKGAVETRPIDTAGVQGQNWIVTNGLKAGDKVIVEGVAKVKDGQEVSAKPYQAQPANEKNAAQPAQAEQKATVKA